MILFSLIDLIILMGGGDLKIAIDVNNSWKILFHHFCFVFFHFLCVRKSEKVKATCLD